MKRLAVLACMVVALAGCASPALQTSSRSAQPATVSTDPAEATEGMPMLAYGDSAVLPDKTGTTTIRVHGAEWYVGTSFPGKKYPDMPYEPKFGTVLVVDVSFVLDGPSEFDMLALRFQPEGGESVNSPPTARDAFGPDPSDGGGRGFLPFDAPRKAGVLTIEDVFGQVYGQWAIPA